MIVKNISRFIFLFAFLILSGNSFGQQLVYTPINPSFGGSPLNGNWMLSQAQAQNSFTAGGTGIDSRFERNPLKDFKESLNRQILSQISRNIISSMFGETGLQEGRYEIGNFIIDITPGSDGITIIINDLGTGDQTTIIIPYL